MVYSGIIVDSHTIFREGFERLLANNNYINIVGSFESGEAVLNLVKLNKIDFIITDVQLSDISYYELIDQVRSINSNCKIIILSESKNPYDISDIYDLNVEAYILKTVSFNSFLNIFKNVMDGKNYFDPDVIPILNKELLNRNINKSLLDKLTRREKQMLIHITEGMSNKEIAVDCNISERTVKNHLSSIFQKIEVSDRTQAAVFAIKTNLVQL